MLSGLLRCSCYIIFRSLTVYSLLYCSVTSLTCSLHIDINACFLACLVLVLQHLQVAVAVPSYIFCSLSIKLHLLAVPVLLTFQCIPLTDRPPLLSLQSFLLLWSKVLLVVHLLTSEILLYLPVGLSCSLYNISSSLYSLSYSLYIMRHLSFCST